MSGILKIQEMCRKIVEVLPLLFNVEAFILDYDFKYVAGTADKENTPPAIFCATLLKVVLELKDTIVVADPGNHPYCTVCNRNKEECEQPVIISPLRIEDKVMGFLALTLKDKNPPREDQERLLLLLALFGELLTGKLIEQVGSDDINFILEQMGAVFNSVDEGILAIDKEGVITHFNNSAENLLGIKPSRILGQHINRFFPEAELLEVLAGARGFKNREVLFNGQHGSQRLIITANPIFRGVKLVGVVASIKSMQDVHRLLSGKLQADEGSFEEILGNSPGIMAIKLKAMRVAGSSSSILITGESGTGKELFARAVHRASRRCDHNFISINCAAIPEELLESDLFGYESGAFTGATKGGKPGKFELAHRGTIFLDEVGDMPLSLQAKILRVLQDRKFFRIGGIKEIDVDVRIISATNKKLEILIKEGFFREDLFYRLNVIPLEIPPLRDRREDIPLLVKHFIAKYNERLNKRICGLTEGSQRLLFAYDWPGNVRELENMIEYAINMEPSEYITEENLPVGITKKPNYEKEKGLKEALDEYERRVIKEYLDRYGWDTPGKLKAARMLGIGKTTLYNRLKKLNLSS